MTDARSEKEAEEGMPAERAEREEEAQTRVATEKSTPGQPAQPRRFIWVGALLAALVLIVFIVGIGSSPYWAPLVIPALPWTAKSQLAPARVAALTESMKALEERTDRRLRALAAGTKASSENAAAIAALNTSLTRLEASVAALAAASGKSAPPPPSNPSGPPAAAAVEQLNRKLAGLESKMAEERAAGHARATKIEGELKRLDAVTASLADRVPQLAAKLEARQHMEAGEAALFLGLLEMREAVDAGRPFREAYAGFVARLRDRPTLGLDPKIVAAAQALAPAAREGVPSLAALAQSLSEETPKTAAPTAPKGSGWTARVAAHLRSLVRIRRTGGHGGSTLEKAFASAEHDLARSDLKSAVATLEALTGADAADVKPWVAEAHKRLQAESALQSLQDLLLSSLAGGTPGAPPSPAPPGSVPGKPG
jgi:hypothetical protein